MSRRNRLKKPKKNSGTRIADAVTPPDYTNNPILFSLERIQNTDYCLSRLDDANKAAFADAIYRRREITWKEIIQHGRHGLGHEKIPKSAIRANIPDFITSDFTDFLVFRFNGNKPMVGYRQKDVFFVLWFDHDFTLYRH